MNINPFDLIKNAQAMKEQFGKMQEEMKNVEVTGSSGGGIVKVTVNGQMEIVKINLDPIAVDPRDITMLQDLIIAAHHQAMAEIQEKLKNQLGPLASSLNIPGM